MIGDCAVSGCHRQPPEASVAFCDPCWAALPPEIRHRVRVARKAAQRHLNRHALTAYEKTVQAAAATATARV